MNAVAVRATMLGVLKGGKTPLEEGDERVDGMCLRRKRGGGGGGGWVRSGDAGNRPCGGGKGGDIYKATLLVMGRGGGEGWRRWQGRGEVLMRAVCR